MTLIFNSQYGTAKTPISGVTWMHFKMFFMHLLMWYPRVGRMTRPWGFWHREIYQNHYHGPRFKCQNLLNVFTFVTKFNIRIPQGQYYSISRCQNCEGEERSFIRILRAAYPPGESHCLILYICGVIKRKHEITFTLPYVYSFFIYNNYIIMFTSLENQLINER